MGLSVGIIGLPNVGKSTLFNALLGRQQALTAPYPFATIEPNVGVVDVLDDRLVKLRDALFPLAASSSQPHPQRTTHNAQPPIVYSSIRFVDIAGLVKGAAEGQGLGNAFLSHIRDVDVILHVVRDFDPSPRDGGSGQVVPRHPDSKNPKHDVAIVETELALKDLEMEERAKNQKKLEPRSGEISSSLSLRAEGLSESASRRTTLLSKPTIYVVNVNETSVVERVDEGRTLQQGPTFQGTTFQGKKVLFVCAKIEEEISRLSRNEQKEFLSAYGLQASGLDRIITECYRLLGLISFFTAGKIEVRAWPLPAGSTAVRAAAVIHSDFEKLFIRAEVIGWKQLVACGAWQEAKEKGFVRTEGRDYKIQEGEVCNFLIGR